jgi:hypothetical protein
MLELFALSDSSSKAVKLGSWDFNILRIEDMEMYASYIRQTQYPANLWSANFAYMWALSQSKERTLLWKIIDGLLVTFVISHKNSLYLFCLPFGNADPERLIDVSLASVRYCFDWNKQDKEKTVIKMVNEVQLDFLKKSARFGQYFTRKTWVGIERHFDINKISALKGKEFENVRNRVNKFRRENPDSEVCLYQDSDYGELLELENRWKSTSWKKYKNVFDGAYYKELIRHGKELEQMTIVIKKGGRIIGMISGCILPSNQAWGSIVKFEENFAGISETLVVEIAKLIHKTNPGIQYMNVGSDLGHEGLRDFKMKFRPVLNYKRYQIYLKQ